MDTDIGSKYTDKSVKNTEHNFTGLEALLITGVPVHNLAFASVGGVVEGVSEGGSKLSASSASHAQRKR